MTRTLRHVEADCNKRIATLEQEIRRRQEELAIERALLTRLAGAARATNGAAPCRISAPGAPPRGVLTRRRAKAAGIRIFPTIREAVAAFAGHYFAITDVANWLKTNKGLTFASSNIGYVLRTETQAGRLVRVRRGVYGHTPEAEAE